MNKLHCGTKGCKQEPIRLKLPFAGKVKCPLCGEEMGIHIKGCRELYDKLPDDPVRFPRWYDPIKKDGSPCNRSAIHGAKASG